jgi:hypothetical protein
MPEPKHALEHIHKCDVEGCSRNAERSLSAAKVDKAGLKIPQTSGSAHLCKEHYKEFKKATKKDRTIERLGW